jgi:hypothetical protein
MHARRHGRRRPRQHRCDHRFERGLLDVERAGDRRTERDFKM